MGAERTAEGLPLSPPQLRLWRELKRDPEGHHLLHGFALELTGDLDPAAMAAALGDVVSRHGVLGSRIAGEEAVPVWVTTAESVPFPVDTLGDLGKAEGPLRNPEAEALRRIFGDLRAPLDPAAESPFRPRLLRLGQRRSILSVVVHRLAADPRSLEILGQDFGTAYRARCAGSPPAWPAAPETPAGPLDGDPGACADGPTPEESLEFWRRRLAGVDSETFELPSDHTPPMTPSRETARLPFELEGEVLEALVALGRRGGTDPRAALLALVLGWLSRISGRGDLVVGTPTDSRRPGQGGAVGPFEDWLPLSGDLGDDPTFEQLVARAGTALEEARDHRAVGSGDLAEALRPERVGRRTPFFRVGLDVRSGADPLPDFGDLEVREYDIGPAPSELDLHFILKPRPGGGLLGDVDFALDLFTPATLDAWLDSLVTFAAAAAHGPRRRISELDLVPRHQRRRLLEHWRGDDLQLGPEVHLGDLFARRAEAHPDAPAVLCGEGDERRAWTYGELDAASDRLARRLRWLGVGPGVPVALCLDPSFDLALATLATVRAGGCYVPLDPSHPLDHLTYMLEDSAAAVLVSRDGVLERGLGHALRSSAGRSVHLLRLDDESASETGDSPVPDRDEPPTRADEVACIMYTAGIVGRPKGVAVTHRGIARLVLADGVFGLGPGDVVAQVSSPSFDAFNVELWGALVHGGRLVGIGGDARSDPAALRRRLKEDGVTSVLLTTARFNALMHLDPTALRGLRTVMVGGEPADPMVLRQVLEADGAPDRLLNLYGPVETATVATWHPVDRLSASARTVPIGRPIPNTSALVLDRRGRLCPVGVTGELHLGGDGLGRGYVGRPAATAGAFVPDPFRRGGRLFRTGELARWRPDGRLEALGRLDQRVEIRGRHVEIARVEAALGRHPRVRQKVVVVQQDAAGESRLVAFVVPPSPGDPPSASELRDHLELQLPDHMIPSAFLCVGMLPMTPHGKVDRRALPRFDLADGFHDGIFTAPRNELEATLEDIWCDVLDLDRVGVDANFFELGGHSLMASQLLARVRAQLGVGLPARAIHQTPTVASMAERIAAITEEAGADPDPRTEPTTPARPQDIPMSYGQRRVWFFDRLLPGTPLFNLAAAVELLGNLDEEALRRALAELARRHRVLRCRVFEQNGKVRLRVDEPQGLPLTVDAPTDSGTDHDGTLQRWVDREASRPFDLARGALRARLLRLNPARHVLVLAVHQLAADEHSLELLVRELSSLYGALVHGTAVPAPEPSAGYEDYARSHGASPVDGLHSVDLAFWSHQLDGLVPLELPTDRPRPAFPDHRGAVLSLPIPAALATGVEAFSRNRGHDEFLTLLAAFESLLARYTGRTDIAVGTFDRGRHRGDLEDIVGLFSDSLVLRTDLDGDPTFEQVVGRVAETVGAARAHGELPFERLVEKLQPDRLGGRHPFFQISFRVAAPEPRGDWRGLESRALPTHAGGAPWDLAVTVRRNRGPGRTLELRYATALFDRGTVERWGRAYLLLLESLLASPGEPHTAATWTDPTDVPLLRSLAAGSRAYPRHLSLWDLFKKQATETPEATAVLHRGRRLTYRRLRDRGAALGGRLAAAGVRPGDTVGLCVERSIDWVVGMVGILSAGGAYVPLDPHRPARRLASIVRDTGPSTVVGSSQALGRFPVPGLAAVHIDGPATEDPDPAEMNGAGVDGSFPAYVAYTSGSSSDPKGVIVPQRAVSRLLLGAGILDLQDDDIVGQGSSPSYDAACFEVWGALLHGSCVAILDREVMTDAAALERAVRRLGIDVLFLSTGLFHRAARHTPGLFRDPRTVLFGGERADPRAVASALAAGDARLVNVYGPTEVSTVSTVHGSAEVTEGADGIPIGTPAANTEAHVMDPTGRPCPVGVPGELWLGGDGLAIGYASRAAATADAFVPHPDPSTPGERLYRTGDLVRLRGEGQLDFLGRLDRRVEIRGFRVELGEVEAALEQHPRVGDRVATVQGEGDGRRLVAFAVVTPRPADPGPSAADLQAFLRGRLPEFAVPTVQLLNALPLTENGKVDLGSLPQVRASALLESAPRIAPRDAVETTVADAFAEVLGVRHRPSVDAGFFDLGGHSMLTAQLVSTLRERLGVDLPIRSALKNPSIADLADRIRRITGVASSAGEEGLG